MEITLTEEMKTALDLIQNTDSSVFITGKAGTGKTTFLKYIAENIQKQCVITASTGIAAINAGGVTLHSLFGIPFGPLSPNDKITSGISGEKAGLLESLETLIIDEVSMARPDVMDFVSRRLQICRRNTLPFGGVQVVMFGDLFQLPPVIRKDEEKIMSQFYEGAYFFNSRSLIENGFSVIELNKIFRQSDEQFISLLNNIREYRVTDDDIEMLEELRNKKISNDFDNKYIHICTHKKDVQNINETKLGKPTHTFYASINGDFSLNNAPCDRKLMLRNGARVMTLINDRLGRYYNGSTGNVESVTDKTISVRLDNGTLVNIGQYEWIAYEYKIQDGKITAQEKGKCTQFPVTLAWAITIHKSQGLTFDRAVIHTKGVFCPGQIYVALSRCRTLGGVVLDSFVGRKHIIANDDLNRFEEAYKNNEYKFNAVAYKKMLENESCIC
jgi:hypothetical protein